MNLKKISGYRLKYIALFSMFLDHIGVIGKAFLSKNVYFLLRAVGRLSFPLFCFILAEGFFHTKNRKKYTIPMKYEDTVIQALQALKQTNPSVELGYQAVFESQFQTRTGIFTQN